LRKAGPALYASYEARAEPKVDLRYVARPRGGYKERVFRGCPASRPRLLFSVISRRINKQVDALDACCFLLLSAANLQQTE